MGKNAFLNFAYKVLADKSMKRTRFATKKKEMKKSSLRPGLGFSFTILDFCRE